MNWIREMALACSLFAAGCSHAASGQSAIAPLHRRGQTTEELVERGRAFAMVGDLTRGEQYLSALRMYRVEEPQSANAQLLYGSLEAAVGDREVARREYETLLRSHPDDSTGHYALAVLFRDAMGDPSSSDAHFREYLRLSPHGEHAAEARASLLDAAR
jgi:tetratricopeptide (TPR) repeat protein